MKLLNQLKKLNLQNNYFAVVILSALPISHGIQMLLLTSFDRPMYLVRFLYSYF